ncbi:hypothetical protein HPB48_013612 [Haemaphysalis longicornis]|uniref:Uncharacterized protein n=1 Tax=Haemaphysalis longicornis TaxID=44386 RepID=A0A9J6FY57_HAELO|nr:hypothetical protein HPB48_013612 [Haemaphysalis longicornis]
MGEVVLQLPNMEKIAVTRRLVREDMFLSKLELHVSCSANPQAYRAVVYLVTENSRMCQLLTYNLRVASFKKINFLRLELPSALYVSGGRSYVNASFTNVALSIKTRQPKKLDKSVNNIISSFEVKL